LNAGFLFSPHYLRQTICGTNIKKEANAQPNCVFCDASRMSQSNAKEIQAPTAAPLIAPIKASQNRRYLKPLFPPTANFQNDSTHLLSANALVNNAF